MQRQPARGRWPRPLRYLHHYTIVSFVLLVASGVSLYLPAIHRFMIPYIPLVYRLHIFLGLIFAMSLLVPLVRVLPKGRRLSKWDWVVPVLFGTPIVITGLLLWWVSAFPASVRSRAFAWHGWLTACLGTWILVHAFLKLSGIRPKSRRLYPRVDWERRRFLRTMATGALGALVVTTFDPAAWFRALQRGGRPQAQTPAGVQVFPAYYTVVDGYPAIDAATYRLQVDGDVARPVALTYEELRRLPAVHETQNFQCVTGWSVPNVRWTGVHLSQLVQLVKPGSNVRYVHFYSGDGVYTECLRLSEALDPTVLLAYEMDGSPLLREQGFPLRLVVPKMYGYKSIKWVVRVSFAADPITGYWEHFGYPAEAYFGAR
ncbi:molybdopterin-dependent oxidoreductase [Alicyclobacillus sendaiensis]|uniref:molybdopterin-dependent oxidoreductase n=1 Tax=Alicyclobacillus sendaiensis TaxID=192387 RepID=UPI0026F47842|nr:molybdopterin-dependent oxidoreductase [Alicyclobacillus sendaiensis]